jgi:hypothetical protein
MKSQRRRQPDKQARPGCSVKGTYLSSGAGGEQPFVVRRPGILASTKELVQRTTHLVAAS